MEKEISNPSTSRDILERVVMVSWIKVDRTRCKSVIDFARKEVVSISFSMGIGAWRTLKNAMLKIWIEQMVDTSTKFGSEWEVLALGKFFKDA